MEGVGLYDQLLVIHALDGSGNTAPCAWFFMPDRQKSSYLMVFRALHDDHELRDISAIYTDFEQAMYTAFSVRPLLL